MVRPKQGKMDWKSRLVRQMLHDKDMLYVMHVRISFFRNILRDFTAERCRSYTIIDHPLYPKPGMKSTYSVHRKDVLETSTSFPALPGPYSLNFLKDFLLTVFWGYKSNITYDIGLGANNLNTLALLLLRKLGRVKKVIYICIDYTPVRYDNPILNALYHWVDRMCCYHSDVLWNSSGRMNEARIKNGVDGSKITHTIVMPDGSNFDYRRRLPLSKIDRKKVVFLGHMRPVMGVKLILESFKEIIRLIPDVRLVMIGDGPELKKYQKKARALHHNTHVTFTGFIKDHAKVDDILRTGALGLAPFVPDKNSYEYYSDVGKPKAYLAAGMPVVITRVPEIADIIKKEKAGIVIEYTKKDFIDAVISLLKNDRMYRLYRKNAIALSKKYIWENIFTTTYKKTLAYLKI